MDLVREVLAGNKRAAARLITLVEEDSPAASGALRELYPHTGKAHVVGISGPPGAGKSTLILRLGQELRRRDRRVGIVAVDPTSPLTGGALLGDRVRMGDLTSDPGVFIRSMGTRGRLGGVSGATTPAVRILDAMGSQSILVETTGAGQSEVEVTNLVDTTVVVVMPGGGDEVQAMKAGILEVADVFAVNKADVEGADATVMDLKSMVELVDVPPDGWRPPVLATVATTGKGVPELVDAVDHHLAHLRASGALVEHRKAQARGELMGALREGALRELLSFLPPGVLDEAVERVVARRVDAASAARDLLGRWGGPRG